MFIQNIMNQTNYKYYNIFAVLGHLASAVAMIFLIKDKDPLIIPYTESYSEWTNVKNGTCTQGSRSFETNNGNFCIGTTTKPVYCNDDGCYGLNLGWLIISFHLLSFFLSEDQMVKSYDFLKFLPLGGIRDFARFSRRNLV